MTPVIDLSTQYQGGFTRPRRSTALLVVHHAADHYPQATGPQDVAAIARWHVHNNGWPGIGYHEVIAEQTNGGPVAAYLVSDPETQRAHIALQNDIAWGICCAADFANGLPAAKWIDALADRLAGAQRRWPDGEIVGHGERARPGHETSCPGSCWLAWKPDLLAAVAARLIPPRTRVIGVGPSISLAQFRAWLRARRAPLAPYFDLITERVYQFASWQDIDPAFIAAIWAHETSQTPGVIGSSDLYRKSNNAGAIKAYGRWPKVAHNGAEFNIYESAQSGLFWLVGHLKEFYGHQGLYDVETVIPAYAPASDRNKPAAYIAAVLRDMAAMREIRA
jgi:hypothetical protein